MKGFKKDGKFRPTENRKKSSLKKTDVKRKRVSSWHGNKGTEVGKGKVVDDTTLIKSLEKRKDEDIDDEEEQIEFDEEQLADMPVEFNIKVLNDKQGIDHKERWLEGIELPVKDFEDIDLEKAVLKALKILKQRGVVPEDAQAKFDDHGFEGHMIDVFIKDDEHRAYDLAEHQGIRMSVEVYADPMGEFSDEHYDEGFREDDANDKVHDKIQDQFDDELSGSTIG